MQIYEVVESKMPEMYVTEGFDKSYQQMVHEPNHCHCIDIIVKMFNNSTTQSST